MGIDEELMGDEALGTRDEIVAGLASSIAGRQRGTATSLTVLN